MKNIIKYCLAFLFFLTIILTSNIGLASIKRDDVITLQTSTAKSEEVVEQEEKEIKFLENVFRA